MNVPTDIMSSPDQVEDLLNIFDKHLIMHRLKIDNVQTYFTHVMNYLHQSNSLLICFYFPE